MATMSEMVVSCIKKQSSERTTDEINNLLPWLRKQSDVFNSLDTGVLYEIIKNCSFVENQRDDIIIRQGEKGDCVYVILSGKVSIFIHTEAVPDNPEEATVIVTEDKFNVEGKTKKELDRSRYGKFITIFATGKSFGELALLNEDCIRNASIIADEPTNLLVVNRDLYNRSMKEVHRQEFNQRMSFVNRSELFSNWFSRYKRQAAFSLRKEKYGFNMPLAIQGEPTNGLIFLLKGQAKVVVNIHQHSYQYPRLNLNNSNEEIKISEINDLERSIDDFDSKRSFQNVSWKRLPYTEAEQRQAQRSIEISIVTGGEIIGDLEQGLELSTYSQSIITIEPTEVYILDAKNFERLINAKRNSKTLKMLRTKAINRLKHRGKWLELRPVPFYSKLNAIIQEVEERQAKEEQSQMESSKVVEKGETTFVEHRGPLINMYGPGSVFYRNRQMRKEKMMTEKKKKNTEMALKGHGGLHRGEYTMSSVFETKVADLIDEYDSSEEPDNSINITERVANINQSKLTGNLDRPQDWETGSVHLQRLEERLQNWFLSVNSMSPDKRVVSSRIAEQYTVLKRFKPDDNEKKIIPGKKIFLRPKVPTNKPMNFTVDNSREKVFITARRFKSSSLSKKSTDELSDEMPEFKDGYNKSLPPFQRDVFNLTEQKSNGQRKYKTDEPLVTVHQYTTDEYKGLKQLLKKREIEMRVFQTAMSI